MFAGERMLKQTPMFTVLFIVFCVLTHVLVDQLFYIPASKLVFDPDSIKQKFQIHRFFTAPFLCDPNWKILLL